MSEPIAWLRSRIVDVRTAVLFSTRLPVAWVGTVEGFDVARASWALPVAGALVGLIGALVYWLAFTLGLAPLLCAPLAVAATILVTGCLHEDGLADTADGFGGGATRARKLEIMRDSSTGSYGGSALVLSILLRVGTLAVLADPALVAPALIAAHVAARATLPAFLNLVPPARADGVSAGIGRPTRVSALAAGIIGAAALALALGPVAGLAAALTLAAVFAGMALIAMRQIGGQTGDVAGALEQVGEMLVLLIATLA